MTMMIIYHFRPISPFHDADDDFTLLLSFHFHEIIYTFLTLIDSAILLSLPDFSGLTFTLPSSIK